MPTHYETLDVSTSASYEKIRQSYHDAARRWHPDRFVGAEAAEAALAEGSMRDANEAWRVLSDEVLRRTYDRGLRGGASGAGQGLGADQGIRVDDGITRIDPRLLDPAFLDNRRQAQLDEISAGQSRFLRAVPIVAFVGLLIGIFVFTAYAQGGDEVPVDISVPGPPIAIAANACVRLVEGGSMLEVPCNGISDGRLIGILDVGSTSSCPIETVTEVAIFGDRVACLGR